MLKCKFKYSDMDSFFTETSFIIITEQPVPHMKATLMKNKS